jgi:hypothetical protein
MDFRLEKLKENLESAVEGKSSEQLSWHLPGKWCAAEVLEDLCTPFEASFAKMALRGFAGRFFPGGHPAGS